jgi:hypothetical protein
MPEINPTFAQFQTDLETLLKELIDKIKRANLTDVELAQVAAEIDFMEGLRELGFDELVDKYFANYEAEILKIASDAKARGVDFANVNTKALEYVTLMDKEYLLGSAKAKASLLQSEMMKAAIRGDTINQTIKALQDIPLTDSQLGTVLNTAYSDISRTATVEIYKDKPSQRFKYVEGMSVMSPTKSEICKYLLLNQNPEGYTMAEIQLGIETPFGIVYETGRDPNFNCTDRWVPI